MVSAMAVSALVPRLPAPSRAHAIYLACTTGFSTKYNDFKPSLGPFILFALPAIYALCKLEPEKYYLRKVYGMI
jgi:hypothetical protein